MRILLAHNSPYYPAHGGGDRSNRLLMEALAARGHHCRVIARTASYGAHAQEELVRELAARGVAVLSSGSGVLLFSLDGVEVHTVANHPNLRGYFAEQIGSFAPEVILASTDDPAQVLLEAALRSDSSKHASRIVYLARATLPLPFGPDVAFPSEAKTAALERVDRIVGVSRYVSDYVRRWSGIEAVHVPISLIEPGPWPALGRFDNEFVTMVNPSATKGLSIFLALARVFPGTKFAAIPTWGTNAADMEALKAESNVTVLDPVDDIGEILERTRAVLIPSLWAEARSRMVVESFVHGVPVLASDVGGLGEAMQGVPYLLPVSPIGKYHRRLDENMVPVAEIPEQDIGPWKEALGRLLSDRAHWEEVAARSRAAGTNYAASLSIEPFEQLLEEVVAAPRRTWIPKDVASSPELSPEKQKLLALRLHKRGTRRAGSWFPTASAASQTALRLFCFPFAGGGAVFFRPWTPVLAPEMAVIPALLPGRETRLTEPPIDSFDALVDGLYEALLPHLGPPCVFFGHSMGAVLAFEIARRLRHEGRTLPLALLVSGARAPQFRMDHVPPPEPTDAQVLDQVRLLHGPSTAALEKPELMRLFLPSLRADTRAYRRYVYSPAPPLGIPIHGYGGREDHQVQPEHLDAWRAQTSAEFSMRLFPGGHFYLKSSAQAFLRALAEDLAPYCKTRDVLLSQFGK